MPLLEVENLHVEYVIDEALFKKAHVHAVDGVTFDVAEGETIGLVGESGCGKSSLGRALLGLTPFHAGDVRFNGQSIKDINSGQLKRFRRQAQMIFQDPFGSLNPRMTVLAAIGEVLQVHRLVEPGKIRERVAELLDDVGLDPVMMDRFPHEFSGGQRQRIGIARALAVSPKLIVADEPVSALDVSVQVQILNLLKDLQKKHELTYVFIAHDLAVVRYICDRIMVMYMGKMVECAPTEELFDSPSHPYTRALIDAVPDVEKGLRARVSGAERQVLGGDVPSPTTRLPGCAFAPRCFAARDRCEVQTPELENISNTHQCACFYPCD
jgi:oligopeptide/dipeptide ABC transporter ATP-binding protein